MTTSDSCNRRQTGFGVKGLIFGLALVFMGGQAWADDPNCRLLAMIGAALPPECLEEADDELPNGEGEGLKDPAANITENAFVSYSGVFALPVADPLPKVKNAASVLKRSQRGVSYTIDTIGLEPMAVHTVWVVVFNNPQFCQEEPCGIGDLPPFGGYPAIEASAFWDLGRVTDTAGQATFTGNVIAGAGAPDGQGQTLFGEGLLDALQAEIHFIIRSHGPVEPLIDQGLLDAALTTGGAGCDTLVRFDGVELDIDAGPNACADAQVSFHMP